MIYSRDMDHSPEKLYNKLKQGLYTAHLSTCSDNCPHAAAVWYIVEDKVIYIVTEGIKLRNIRKNPKVALSIENSSQGMPEWTVTILGTADIVTDESKFLKYNKKINNKYGADEDDWEDNTLVEVTVGSYNLLIY